MELKKIKTDKCPHCGSDARIEEIIRNGIDDNNSTEIKAFECGFELICKCESDIIIQKFSCPNSEEYKKLKTRRVDALNNLCNFIDNMDSDDEFKDTIRSILLKGLS